MTGIQIHRTSTQRQERPPAAMPSTSAPPPSLLSVARIRRATAPRSAERPSYHVCNRVRLFISTSTCCNHLLGERCQQKGRRDAPDS
eukprot:4018900-Pyramimonas_sp.AAC.1